MKVKKISCFNGHAEDYIKVVGHDGEIVYISMESIISITVQTNGDIVIRCIHNESHLLQNVTKGQLKDVLAYGEEFGDDEEDYDH